MKRLLFFGLLLGPTMLMAQRKEDFLQIQRDVAQLQEQVKQLQHSQDEKMAALTALVQQAVQASSGLAPSLTALEQDIGAKLNAQNAQQTKLVEPVVILGTKVDQMSDDFRSVATNVSELVRKVNALDSKLSDISSAIRTLTAPPPTPPTAVQSGPPAPPAGVSEETSYQTAYRDYQGGKAQLAMDGFLEYLKYFSDRAHAPDAQYYIAQLYWNAMQWGDAAKAFDAVVERFPANSKTQEAFYMKGVALMTDGSKTEAGAVFKDFIEQYPSNDHAAAAKAHLRELGLLPKSPANSKKKK
jgi:TolA-binding protein